MTNTALNAFWGILHIDTSPKEHPVTFAPAYALQDERDSINQWV